MIRIHHLGTSRSDRIIWLAHELGIEYELVVHQRGADFRSPAAIWELNPMGKAPVIEDGDVVVFESGAILEYLLEQYGQGRLQASSSQESSLRYKHWMHAAESTLMTPILFDFLGAALQQDLGRLNNFIAGEYKTVLGYLDNELSAGDYIAGAEFSAADIMVAYPLFMAEGLAGKPLQNYSAINAYLQRLKQRDAYKKSEQSF